MGWTERATRTPVWQDPLISTSLRRISTTARQHSPLVTFILLASFLLICIHLPWSSNYANITSSSSNLPFAHIAENKTKLRSNGTLIIEPNKTVGQKRARFAKIAVASGFEDILYEKALQTHIDHAERWGYPLYMARENAADGMYNKVAYIMNVLLNELYKPAEDRVEWLFYFDADSIIMNQQIPLEIFEPPSDFSRINWIAGRDWFGLNAGVLMIRVCQWSLNLMTRTMTYKHYHPNEDYPFEEQTVFARLTENEEEFQKQMIYVPRSWFNAYFYNLHEVKPGMLLSHFPHPNYKWHIYEWLKILDADKSKKFKPVYDKPLEDTEYPNEIKRFWQVKRRADNALKGFKRNLDRGADPIQFGMQHQETKGIAESFREKYEALKKASQMKTDEPEELDKMVTEAEEINAKLISQLMEYFETHDNPPPQAGF